MRHSSPLANHNTITMGLHALLRDEAASLASTASMDSLAVSGIASDSREVLPGDVFVAIRGGEVDGNAYIDAAIDKGAVAIITDGKTSKSTQSSKGKSKNPVPIIAVADARLTLGRMAARFYQVKPPMLMAITGTNGKTSVADFMVQIWQRNGWTAASIGTLGVRLGMHIPHAAFGDGSGISAEGWRPSVLTTPDAISLGRTLTQLAHAEITHVALEASSHGIAQHRLAGLPIAVAGFTNLTRDHFDYHQNEADYFAAKARLFTEVLREAGTAVINSDSAHGKKLLKLIAKRQLRILSVGRDKAPNKNSTTHIQIAKITRRPWGQEVTIRHAGAEYHLPLALLGAFQVENAVLAAALGHASGMDIKQALLCLPYLRSVPGRMQAIAVPESTAQVVIDYAHTPDALAIALQSLRESTSGQLGVVFGCGGERDQGKRGEMGKLAARLADFAIVTDDNPRHEDPAQIRAQIRTACPNAIEVGDRAKAIAHGVAQLKDGDVLLVAGKGHESQQLIGDDVLPFCDATTVRAIFAQHGKQKHEEMVT